MLAAARDFAATQECSRIWLVTTNDNEHAQHFYENRGFKRVAVHEGALVESRRLKPEIPVIGLNCIEMRDEIEYELRLA